MLQATPDTPRTRSRWRPRFSLRTLLLASLLCGSGMLLWRNRAPWAVKYTIQEEREIRWADFSPSDKYLFTETCLDQYSKPKDVIKIYETDSGKLHLQLMCERPAPFEVDYSISPAENYFQGKGSDMHAMDMPFCELWRMDTGASVRFENLKPTELQLREISAQDHFALAGSSKHLALVKLPSMEIVARMPPGYFGTFSPDEQWLEFDDIETHTARLYSTQSGKEREGFFLENKCDVYQFSPDSRMAAYTIRRDNSNSTTHLVDILTGKQVVEFPGEMGVHGSSFSSDSRYLVTYAHNTREALIWDLSAKKEPVRVPSKWIYGSGLRIVDGHLISGERLGAWDARTGEVLWSIDHPGRFAPSGDYVYDSEEREVRSVATGDLVHAFEQQKPNNTNGETKHWRTSIQFHFANKHALFWAQQYTRYNDPLRHQIQIWHRRRPEFWYGFAWLPEFWLTVVLAGALLWSLSRPLT